jgi:parallel beta-helix repeat protein
MPLGVLAAVACTGCATAQTGSPQSASPSDAVVAGKVVRDTAGQVEYWAQFGPTTSYGSETAHQTITVAKATPTSVQVTITGLARSTTYHYRLCARDETQNASRCGDDRTLTTQAVGCGETVTRDVRLTADLSCEASDQTSGLVVGANGVSINLADHRLGNIFFEGGGGTAGIDNSGGYDDVTVRNGRINGWGDAIVAAGGDRMHVLAVDASGAQVGLRITGGANDEVHNSEIFGRSTGIVASATELVVTHSTIGGLFEDGIVLSGDSARIAYDDITSSGALLSERGVRLSGNGNRIVSNHVHGWVDGNIVVDAGSGNVLRENEVFGTPALPPAEPDGIRIAAAASNTLVRGNSAHENGDDGIDVRSASTRVGDNTANYNGDFGIDAVAGVTDLGGNAASGNGNPLQCRNVFCQ